jgi:serine/threonine protein phosphatase PrpC
MYCIGFHSNTEDGGKEMKIVHQESFIARRTQGSIIGPEAIFSRYNLSINMTRSMGDKYGPRSVIAVPDISVLTIPVGQFARFILCSDGVWDVVTTDEMRVLALDYENVSETAVTLCYDAQARRINRRMRMDDITVIVVDVNPELFPRRSLADCCAVS